MQQNLQSLTRVFFGFVFSMGLGSAALASGGVSSEGANLDLLPTPKADRTLGTKPMKPQLTSPAFRESVGSSVKLTWKGPEGVSNFHVQVASDPNFKWLVKNEYNVQGEQFEVSGLESGKKYFWRVASVSPKNDPGWSKSSFEFSSFTVK